MSNLPNAAAKTYVVRRWSDQVTRLLVVLPMLAVAAAAWRYGLADEVRLDYLTVLLKLSVAVAGAAAVIWLAARRSSLGHAFALGTALVVTAGSVAHAGAATAFAAVVLGFTAAIVGRRFMTGQGEAVGSHVLVGLALLAAVVGWLLPFAIHDPRAYILVFGTILVLGRRAVAAEARSLAASLREIADDHVSWLLLALAALAVASLGLWLPSVNYDDNAVHLALPEQLLADRYYRLDVSSQLWAVAPWSSNVLHGIAALLAGAEARAAVTALWLLLGMTGAYRLALAVGGTRAAALSAAAVFASHPLSAHFASTMQVDGAVAAVLMHLAAVLAESRERPASPIVAGILLGLLAGLKVSNIVYALPALVWLGWQAVRDRAPLRMLRLCLVAAAVGGASYAYALLVTGNPVFPLYNAIFQSPYMPAVNFQDLRWSAGANWRSLWDLTFETGRFAEAYPGAAGVALLVTLPGAVIEAIRNPKGRWILVWFSFSGAVLFAQVQYLRYVFPAIAVLTTIGLVGLQRVLGSRALFVTALLVLAANAVLMPTTSWIARDNPWNKLVMHGPVASRDVQRAIVPERELLARLKAREPEACVLMTDPRSPFTAGFGGRAHAMAWYDPRLNQAREWANAGLTGERWTQLLQSTGFTHVVTGRGEDTLLAQALRSEGFDVVDRESGAELWSRDPDAVQRCDATLLRLRDQSHRLFHPGDQH